MIELLKTWNKRPVPGKKLLNTVEPRYKNLHGAGKIGSYIEDFVNEFLYRVVNYKIFL
jgi:hypothetical protein